MFFAQLAHCQDDPAIHQPKIAGINRNFNIRDLAQQPVEIFRCGQFEPGFAGPFGAHGINHFVALAPFCDHLEHHFGRILQVGVHDDHRITLRKVRAGRNRHLVAKITTKVDYLNTLILLM